MAAEHGRESDAADAGTHFEKRFPSGKLALRGKTIGEFVLEEFHSITELG